MIEVERKPVSELCELIVDCVNRTAPVVEHETPYKMIRTTNVRDGRISLDGARNVTEETFERWTRRAKVLDGDVILTREAPIGEVGYVNGLGQVFLGQRIMQYRPDPELINPRYFFYAFRSKDLQHQFGSHDGSGSVVSHIRVGDCHKFEMSVPDRRTQDAIVNLLGALDDKIELNRRMNETLEEMARALFRDWFVDFGPTRRQMTGATDPAAIMGDAFPPEKAAILATLFPAKFGDDVLPEGWETRPVSDFGKLKGGKQLPKTEFVADGPFPVFGGAGHMGQSDKFNADGYVITVGRVGAYCGNFVSHRGKAWVNNNASVFQLSKSTEPEWFYLALRELDLEPIKKGAAQPFVSNGDINELPLVEPGEAVRKATNGVLSSLLMKLEANEQENQTLAEMRDLLLPKLMSGEVRLRGAEAAL